MSGLGYTLPAVLAVIAVCVARTAGAAHRAVPPARVLDLHGHRAGLPDPGRRLADQTQCAHCPLRRTAHHRGPVSVRHTDRGFPVRLRVGDRSVVALGAAPAAGSRRQISNEPDRSDAPDAAGSGGPQRRRLACRGCPASSSSAPASPVSRPPTGLSERGVSVDVVEARDYLGGRVGGWPDTLADGSAVAMNRGFHAFFRQYYNLRALLRRADPHLSALTPGR